ncbi:hypothetical protein H3N56_02970 [Cetobacterium sp. 2A]|uniref:hypothetical protein n=1 Tax=Cetobacterium sp. 2A TaxID=2754723 RepID=UPI00163CE933|nr:hypothetical protein [Cetobacterium sp. 2A]MBC2855456.1 hypothetical protein [Cetobacterium sp. 2A]
MNDKYSKVEAIVKDLQGRTGMNFQNGVSPILREYYKTIKKQTFTTPDPIYAGDDKNDGWIEEEGIFYQIYAPRTIIEKKSIIGDLREKFRKDLEGLVKHVVEKNNWGGQLSEFIFLYNTHDGGLPAETKSNYKDISLEISKKYSCEFKSSLVNLDHIRDLLGELSSESLSKLLKQMGNFTIDVLDEITPKVIIDTIELICEKVYFLETTSDLNYKIITPEEKLSKNNLTENYSKINRILKKTMFMEEVEGSIINSDFELKDKFDILKAYIIREYLELKNFFSGDELYNNLIQALSSLVDKGSLIKPTVELIVVFLFERCDIFEK